MSRRTWPKGYRKRWQAELEERIEELRGLKRELRWAWLHRDEVPEEPLSGIAAWGLPA